MMILRKHEEEEEAVSSQVYSPFPGFAVDKDHTASCPISLFPPDIVPVPFSTVPAMMAKGF